MNEKKINLSYEECPYCLNKKMEVITYDYYVPNFGDVIIISKRCSKCGYRHSDILLKDIKPPTRYVMTVNNINDLDIRVIKSSTATIRIPELGFEMTPGPASKGFITNVEGILNRVIDAIERLSTFGSLDMSKKEKIQKLKDTISLVKQGKKAITLIIEDPFGNSAIITKDTKKVKKEEIH